MLKLLIVDDEKHCRNVIRKFLIELFPDYFLIEEADDITAATEKLNEFSPDILILDIRMNEGTGFDLLDLTDTSDIQIIFTTAYGEFALNAFKYSAIHYLLKPVDKKELKEAINRCFKNENSVIIEEPAVSQTLFINSERNSLNLEFSQICYIKADGSYSYIHLASGEKIVTSRNIGDYESLLPNTFFRIHKSYIINLLTVKSFNSNTNEISTKLGAIIPVSRRKKSEFKNCWKACSLS